MEETSVGRQKVNVDGAFYAHELNGDAGIVIRASTFLAYYYEKREYLI